VNAAAGALLGELGQREIQAPVGQNAPGLSGGQPLDGHSVGLALELPNREEVDPLPERKKVSFSKGFTSGKNSS